MTARAILTRKAFENAITLHAAIGGSLNAVMHLIAVAEEARVEVSAADFDAIHRRTPVLVDAKTAGRYPTELFWYAGGVPALMARLRDRLHLDALTVTGATVGENLVKSHAVADSMLTHTGPARVFDREEDAIEAVVSASIQPGDVVVVRYQGPRATGMPEMFFLSELIASDPVLAATTALLTDGRFSGASRGPCIGYAYPETLDGGPLAFLRDRDLVEIDIPRRTLDVVGVDGTRVGADEVEREFTRRRAGWTRPVVPHRGALGQYTALAKPALLGAGLRTSLTA